MCFSKHTVGLFGVHNAIERAVFEPTLSNFGPCEGRKGLENGPIWDHKCLKNGSILWFSKNDPSSVLVPKPRNTAHFELLLSHSHPLSSAYLICRLRPPSQSQYSILIRARGTTTRFFRDVSHLSAHIRISPVFGAQTDLGNTVLCQARNRQTMVQSWTLCRDVVLGGTAAFCWTLGRTEEWLCRPI